MADIEYNTHHARIKFGKYDGELVTRMPYSYLVWGITVQHTGCVEMAEGWIADFKDVAKAEIKRRGERIPGVDVSSHAIDRISVRCLRKWRKSREGNEGIYTWAQRMTMEALDAYVAKEALGEKDEKMGVITILHNNIRWVILMDLAIPILKTVKT